MKTPILSLAAVFYATVLFAQEPDYLRMASERAAEIDRTIEHAERDARELRTFQPRYGMAYDKPHPYAPLKQYWFRNPEQRRERIVQVDAELAALRAMRWDGDTWVRPEATFTELRTGNIATPTDYSTGRARPVQAEVIDASREDGLLELSVAWTGYFGIDDIDRSRLMLQGVTFSQGDILELPPLWVKEPIATPSDRVFVVEFATDQQMAALKSAVLRVAAPKREVRQWSDASGAFEIGAVLLAYDRKQQLVTLEKPDGSKLTLPAAKLSTADREFVELTLGARLPAPAVARKVPIMPVSDR